MPKRQAAQGMLAAFAICLTAFLWVGNWVELLSKGAYTSFDLTKLYLAIMAGYEGVAEASKWVAAVPTDSTQDPRFERANRGGIFVLLWLVPLLYAYARHFTDKTLILPPSLEKITLGLATLFFVKATSRGMRHEKHGMIDPRTGEVTYPKLLGQSQTQENAFAELVYQKISAAPNGMSLAELMAAIPNTTKPRLYRAFDQLIQDKRIERTGKRGTPEVRYKGIIK